MTVSGLWTIIITTAWSTHGWVSSGILPPKLWMQFMSSFSCYGYKSWEVVYTNMDSISFVRQSLNTVQTFWYCWRYHRSEFFIWIGWAQITSALHTSLWDSFRITTFKDLFRFFNVVWLNTSFEHKRLPRREFGEEIHMFFSS